MKHSIKFRTTLFAVLFICAGVAPSLAQTFTLSGIVTDKNGNAIAGADAALANYQRSAATTSSGKFQLNELKPGNYILMIRMLGYQPFQQTVKITDKSHQINVTLKDAVEDIEVIEVVAQAKRNPINRERELRRFQTLFLGTTLNAAKCRIVNPEVIYFSRKDDILRVVASDFIEIENSALGYKIKYLLKEFNYDEKNQSLTYQGYATFEALTGDEDRKQIWARNRTVAYNGSMQHFFTTLAKGDAKKEGYILHQVTHVPVAMLETASHKIATAVHELERVNAPKTQPQISEFAIGLDTLVSLNAAGQQQININYDLLIIYTGEKETGKYQQSEYCLERPEKFGTAQVSQLHMPNGPLLLDRDGLPDGLTKAIVFGYWSYEKAADLLPLDYIPE